jgi:hypothetical protein
MRPRLTLPAVVGLCTLVAVLCFAATGEIMELKSYPVDDTAGLITLNDVAIDKDISSDGKGSLKVTAAAPRTVRLYEVNDLNVDDARLIYRAHLRTENVNGKVYLEMWCRVSGKGEFFSRGLARTLTGTTGWTTEEIPFFLEKGQTADNVKLNLVIDGTGTAWIDDIKLLKAPLK